MTESVGIIGAGRIGRAMARIARRAGRPVTIANRRGPQSLMWPDVPKAVDGLAWEGRTVIDPTNAFDPSDLDGRTSSELVADLVTPARVVKTANNFAADVLASDPHQAGGRRVMFLSGEDAGAKAEVGELFEAAGFFAIDLGGLRDGGQLQQFGGPLAGQNLIRLA
ncbi:NAD(P)-binding domain-containing protein [Solirubrobacter ginsenosidimutans]|uniref:NAD(P)-binding domain-containing protein n=1 Tax=Solirubrobacter ginsenosidimutans TaxID=490573 RepID=A0A9X3S383_9ACTN|nr:NAD(P)-binding domain-containing protein [Solirubrobacter ginsenosidimutans]MDA0164369.1 NAD(P)-binding domain-containing protein [Solirubrobacter ginsenosidimutans]